MDKFGLCLELRLKRTPDNFQEAYEDTYKQSQRWSAEVLLDKELDACKAQKATLQRQLNASELAVQKKQTEIASMKQTEKKLQEESKIVKQQVARQEEALLKEQIARREDSELLQQKTDQHEEEVERLQITHQRAIHSLRRSYRHTDKLAATQYKNLAAIESLLEASGILPFTHLLDKVDVFNEAVTQAAKFLASSIVRRHPEAFPEEIDRASNDVEALMGLRLTDVLSSQSESPDDAAASLKRISRILLQTFLVRFCVLNIQQISVYTRFQDTCGPIFANSLALSSTETPTLDAFKASLLKTLSSIFKVAGWALLGPKNRSEFSDLLDPLYGSRESLRAAVAETFTSARIEILLAEEGVVFHEGVTVDFFETLEEEINKKVAGTMGVGLVKVATPGVDTPELRKSILRAQVVLESELERALDPQYEEREDFSDESDVECDGAPR